MAKTSEEVERSHLPTEACGLRVGDVSRGRPLEVGKVDGDAMLLILFGCFDGED